MTLYNNDSLVLETASAANTLPDPVGINGRTHILSNTGTATVVWSSTGATPFVVDGVNVATLSVPRGQLRQVQSDGVRWVTAPTAARRVFASSGVTDAGGNITFNFVPAFSVTPVAVSQIGPSADTALVEGRITALTASSCTVNVRRSPAVVILGISVLQVPQNAPGVTVQLQAIAPGQGV